MPAYNVQGAPAIGRLPGLPAKRNVINTTINQYFSAMAAEKVVVPANNAQMVTPSTGTYFWATGRVMNIETLGLAYWQSGASSYQVQPFTYGNNVANMVGAPVSAQFTTSAFGHPLKLWDGSILMASRTTRGSFCRITVNPATYAITQDTAFLSVPTSGTCVSGEAFTCTPTTAEFGYTLLPAFEPQWFVNGNELVLFGTITIAGATWVAAFVFNQAGQLTRVHKITTYTTQGGSSGTYLYVRKVNSYYHIVVQNRGASASTFPTVARYFSCSADFSDITAFAPEQSWGDGTTYGRFVMAADSKAVLIMLASSASPPVTSTTFSTVYRLDSKGKPISTSANSAVPALTLDGFFHDLLTYTSYSSDADALTRLPNNSSTNSLSSVPAEAGYLAVSTNHSLTEAAQANLYKGGYKFMTMSDANGDLLMRFYPRVVVNQVDDGTAGSSYSAVNELCELSGGYWLGLQQTTASSFSLRLYKEQV